MPPVGFLLVTRRCTHRRSHGKCAVRRLFYVDFNPGLRTSGREVHEKSAVNLRDF